MLSQVFSWIESYAEMKLCQFSSFQHRRERSQAAQGQEQGVVFHDAVPVVTGETNGVLLPSLSVCGANAN